MKRYPPPREIALNCVFMGAHRETYVAVKQPFGLVDMLQGLQQLRYFRGCFSAHFGHRIPVRARRLHPTLHGAWLYAATRRASDRDSAKLSTPSPARLRKPMLW